ncbi:hypothetical protein ACGFI3_46130 [Nonomuraea wenchangensis]|uniref:hypothetical protein n=1 Tax=Nonomuraea wenchangensis TaxID=568860 RepID=UPI003716E651
MAQVDEDNMDRVAVAVLRKLKPEIQTDFLASPELQQLLDADRQRLYKTDAELAEAERQRNKRKP